MEEPGEYTVGIRFNEKHIPGSPYKVYIQVLKQANGSILLFESIKPLNLQGWAEEGVSGLVNFAPALAFYRVTQKNLQNLMLTQI